MESSKLSEYVAAGLALIMAGTVVYLAVTGGNIPEVVVGGFSAVVGYFLRDITPVVGRSVSRLLRR